MSERHSVMEETEWFIKMRTGTTIPVYLKTHSLPSVQDVQLRRLMTAKNNSLLDIQ